jgi:hypothetical protein
MHLRCAQSRLLGSPETRSLIFLIKNSPDQVEGYLDYLQPKTKKDPNKTVETAIRPKEDSFKT